MLFFKKEPSPSIRKHYILYYYYIYTLWFWLAALHLAGVLRCCGAVLVVYVGWPRPGLLIYTSRRGGPRGGPDVGQPAQPTSYTAYQAAAACSNLWL